jgi:hypothetical protein
MVMSNERGVLGLRLQVYDYSMYQFSILMFSVA